MSDNCITLLWMCARVDLKSRKYCLDCLSWNFTIPHTQHAPVRSSRREIISKECDSIKARGRPTNGSSVAALSAEKRLFHLCNRLRPLSISQQMYCWVRAWRRWKGFIQLFCWFCCCRCRWPTLDNQQTYTAAEKFDCVANQVKWLCIMARNNGSCDIIVWILTWLRLNSLISRWKDLCKNQTHTRSAIGKESPHEN